MCTIAVYAAGGREDGGRGGARRNHLSLITVSYSSGQCEEINYSQTSLIRTPKGQNQVSALQRCPYYRGRECIIFGISGTKRTVRNRGVFVL